MCFVCDFSHSLYDWYYHNILVCVNLYLPVCSRFQPAHEVDESKRASRFINLIFQEFGFNHTTEKDTLKEEVLSLEHKISAMDERLRVSSELQRVSSVKVDTMAELQRDTNRLMAELFVKVTSLQDTVDGMSEELSHRNTLLGSS